MTDVVLLDIDGTLNESQQPVPDFMQQKLQQLARHKQVYFVTGNTYTKAVDLLNGPIAMYSGIFCNNGDELRSMRGKLIWQDTETPPLPANIGRSFLIDFYHDFDVGNNCIEWRSPRFVNICPVGRFATNEQRDSWEGFRRESYLEKYKNRYNVDGSIGGKVSIDIYSKGADKSRACKWINDTGRSFVFIGDRTEEGGNDYPVKKYCEKNHENLCLTTSRILNTVELIDGLLKG